MYKTQQNIVFQIAKTLKYHMKLLIYEIKEY
jgi:hypothetical protein